jgi:ketosteroid isomerase-like protein
MTARPVAAPAAPPREAEEAAGIRSAERWVAEFVEGWRSPRSADAFADHFDRVCTDDVRMIQPQLPTLVGKQAFREGFVRPTFELIPDLHATVHDWAASGDMILIHFTLEGTLGGKPVRWPCIDRVVLRDGLACERRAFFDPGPLLQAVATRPRAWPTFARIQGRRLLGGLGGGGRS